MKSHRAEFSAQTKALAWQRCGGRCEMCGNEIRMGNGPEYHHVIDAAIDGSAELDNCQVLCIRPCHKAVTDAHRPAIVKTKRILEKRIGVRAKGRFRKPPPGMTYDWSRGGYRRVEE